MPDAEDIAKLGNAAIVAPAGHGKTELITQVAALGRRALILTHTHAGVHAIRLRLKRMGIPHAAVSVDTIAGWSMRYAHAFPKVAQPPEGMPRGAEWDQLYRGATESLGISAVRQVVESSYDRVLIDEYQDCGKEQHELACKISSIVPTLIFGDPMQGIFEFAGANLDWDGFIHKRFPLACTLDTPYRWIGKNPDLGAWIAEVRGKLMRGEAIDLAAGPITFRESDDAFDMGTFFERIDDKEGSIAAIHCNKQICYKLAKATRGGFQAIEEISANRMQAFAGAWDAAHDARGRLSAITNLLNECFHKTNLDDGAPADPLDEALKGEMQHAAANLAQGNGADAALRLLSISRRRARWRLFRGELWRDAERAIAEMASGRSETMVDAAARVRQRASLVGRKLPKRTVSTPLLLKGLEFDHIITPDAGHFPRERLASAKLFYVAVSRATRSLTISAKDRWLSF